VALFADLVDAAEARWELDDLDPGLRDDVVAHLDRALAAPALLWLDATAPWIATATARAAGRRGRRAHRAAAAHARLARRRRHLERGRDRRPGLRRALGLVGSYLPMFARLPELYAGEISGAPTGPGDGREWHIQRELNLRASAAAHGRYFGDADAMIARIFDREPLAEQPRFVLDVGCGDASWLTRIHALVRDGTLCGRHLAERQAATGEQCYPTTRPFVAVSLNHLLSGGSEEMIPGCDGDVPRQDTWRPGPGVNRRDGRGLHELLYERRDLRHPRLCRRRRRACS